MTWTTTRTSPSDTLALVRQREEAAQKSSFRILDEYQGRPVEFFEEKLGVTVWGGMRRMLEANDQVAIPAGKNLSKSYTSRARRHPWRVA